MRVFRTLLLTILLATGSLAQAQSQGVMTVETSPAGSTQIRYFIASTYCNWGFPQTTQIVPVSGGWQITTALFLQGCFTISPPGPPVTMIADLGYLRQGQYTVTWSFSGGIGYGTRSATFTIAEDQVPTAAPACGVNGSPLTVLAGVPFMGFTPPSPNSSQAVTITVGMFNYNPMGAVAIVQGNVIDVTLTASFLGFAAPPALSCSSVTVGPLSTGNYVVNLILVDPNLPSPLPIQTAIGPLRVGAAPPIPTLSNVALAALTLLLSVAAWPYVRSRFASGAG